MQGAHPLSIDLLGLHHAEPEAFRELKAALPILARQNTSSWWWTTPWATYLTQLIQFWNWNPDTWQNKYSHHNRKSLGKSSTNATFCCNTNATELASFEGLIKCWFSTANLSRGMEASQSSAWGVPWQLKTSLSLLHSPEKLAVFIVCKNPSDCILHAEAPCPSRLSAYHVCKTCQGPSVRKLCWSDCQQLSAHREASQHSAWEQLALSHRSTLHIHKGC